MLTCLLNWLPLAKQNIFQKYKSRDFIDIYGHKCCVSRYRYPHGLRCRFAAVRLVGVPVRIPPGGMDVSCGYRVLSSTGLCIDLITRPEES